MEKILAKKKVAVLFGGRSEEHNIALKSAYNIIKNMDMEKYELVLIGITKQGNWMLYQGSAELIPDDNWIDDTLCKAVQAEDLKKMGIEVVFPVLHGKYGEDGTIQGVLETAGLPYVGCRVDSSVLCMNKDLAQIMVRYADIHVTPSVILHSYETLNDKQAEYRKLKYPLFVKPADSGSSFGVTKVSEETGLASAVEEARKFSKRVLIEEGVEGCEVGCAILGSEGELIAGEVDQIELTHGFFRIHQEETPEIKSENSVIHVPAKLDSKITEKIKETAKCIYRVLECTGLARIDMFLTRDNEIIFNEVNSMPGFTSYSRYPRMMEAAGMGMPEIIDRVIESAI